MLVDLLSPCHPTWRFPSPHFLAKWNNFPQEAHFLLEAAHFIHGWSLPHCLQSPIRADVFLGLLHLNCSLDLTFGEYHVPNCINQLTALTDLPTQAFDQLFGFSVFQFFQFDELSSYIIHSL